MAHIALLSALLSGGADARPLEIATLGGGCFWCLEAIYEDIAGVDHVVSGYAGGRTPAPSYEQVCAGYTGHAEVVQIHFDPEVVTYETLLEVFWTVHDPTSLNRQGADLGTQYRSIILWHDEAQRATAEASLRAVQARYGARPVVTELVPLTAFYPAEDHHQDYFAKHPDRPYCASVISPKLEKFRAHHRALIEGGGAQ